MRRFALAAATFALLVPAAHGQEYQGNWVCRDGSAQKAGILTLYGGVYGFAARTAGDTASGTGAITSYTDGVGFNDGPLRAARGIEAGRMVAGPSGGSAVQLETPDAILMLCTPL
ncbi:hypothetical protein VE25_01505 [Devosia geojensis]|uniref:DUF2147 domain-containing protein n=1 Tax=Devosia geojensis TaxID=443610 RepID=A0A0F5FXI9_9HYPH|nr:hypothetical protein [Devosia geojensis]KKB13533.1 hypothetical protein VE25_01505 [Devosia geojensis]